MNLAQALTLSLIAFVLCTAGCNPPELSSLQIRHFRPYAAVENVAVIVEPRNHPLLIPVIQNAMKVLGEGWAIQVFHGTENADLLLSSELKTYIDSGRIRLTTLGVANITQPQYSRLMLDTTFWESVLGENVLIFQTDSILCANSTYRIEDFLKYDFIGAPYNNHTVDCYVFKTQSGYQVTSSHDTNYGRLRRIGASEIAFHSTMIGNGGLSLRKKTKTLELLNRFRIHGSHLIYAEDDYFSCLAQDPRSGIRAPTIEDAKAFSVGYTYHPNAFGVHQPWTGLPLRDLHALDNSCEDFAQVLKPFYAAKVSGW